MQELLRDRKIQPAPALSLTAAVAMLAARGPVAPVQIPTATAAGCVAAAALHVPGPVPAEALALRAGIAVAAADTVGATATAPCFPSLPPSALMAGAALPAGADAVLPPHAVRRQDGLVELLATVMPGDGVRRTGGDLDPGRAVVRAGARLHPRHCAALRLAGVAEVPVRRPRLVLIVPDAAAALVAAWLAGVAQARGAVCEVATDWLAADTADLLVHLGAPAPALETAAAVAMRPGETIFCGRRADRPVLAVGARLEEALAAWLLLVRPVLAALAAEVAPGSGATHSLTRKIVSAPGICDLALVRRVAVADRTFWEPLATGDLPWQAIADAEAWLSVPADSEGHAAGEAVAAEYL